MKGIPSGYESTDAKTARIVYAQIMAVPGVWGGVQELDTLAMIFKRDILLKITYGPPQETMTIDPANIRSVRIIGGYETNQRQSPPVYMHHNEGLHYTALVPDEPLTESDDTHNGGSVYSTPPSSVYDHGDNIINGRVNETPKSSVGNGWSNRRRSNNKNNINNNNKNNYINNNYIKSNKNKYDNTKIKNANILVRQQRILQYQQQQQQLQSTLSANDSNNGGERSSMTAVYIIAGGISVLLSTLRAIL